MRKRLVRKAFDMMQDLADKEDKEVSGKTLITLFCTPLLFFQKMKSYQFITGLQKILGEFW